MNLPPMPVMTESQHDLIVTCVFLTMQNLRDVLSRVKSNPTLESQDPSIEGLSEQIEELKKLHSLLCNQYRSLRD